MKISYYFFVIIYLYFFLEKINYGRQEFFYEWMLIVLGILTYWSKINVKWLTHSEINFILNQIWRARVIKQ